MSTLAFTVLACAIAALAMLWLLIVDRPKTAMRTARRRRGSTDGPWAAAVGTVATPPYRRPSLFKKLRALLGLGGMAFGLGIVVTAALLASVAAAALTLRQVTK